MILKIFSVFDSKAEAFLPPFYMKTKGEAIRAIQSVVQDPKHQFSIYSEDFTLFEVGSFDDSSCKFDLLKTPYSLGLLVEFKNSTPSPVAVSGAPSGN